MKPLRAAALAVLVVAWIAGCGDGAPTGPPSLRLGVDVCDRCAMSIAEARYAAAALVDDNGEQRTLRFDDIGCLAMWEADTSGSTIRRRWVHDQATEAWIEADASTYSRTPELTTPMGSGLAAFKSAPDAGAFVAERGGETLAWDAVVALARDGTLQFNPFQRQEAAP